MEIAKQKASTQKSYTSFLFFVDKDFAANSSTVVKLPMCTDSQYNLFSAILYMSSSFNIWAVRVHHGECLPFYSTSYRKCQKLLIFQSLVLSCQTFLTVLHQNSDTCKHLDMVGVIDNRGYS